MGAAASPGTVALERAIRDLASENLAVLIHAELRRCGLSAHQVQHRIETGRLRPLHRGVYLVDSPVPPPGARELAAVRAAGAHVAVSGPSAARLRGWRVPPNVREAADSHVELTGGRSAKCAAVGIQLRRVMNLPAADVEWIGPIPVTTAARTVVDLIPRLSFRELDELISELFAVGQLTRDALNAQVERSRRRAGVPTIRAILETGVLLTESHLERRLLAAVRSAGLPAPETQVELLGHRVDAFWRAERVVVEANGFGTHGQRRRTFERDHELAQRLQLHGISLFPISHAQLTRTPEATMRRLAAVLARSSRPESWAVGRITTVRQL